MKANELVGKVLNGFVTSVFIPSSIDLTGLLILGSDGIPTKSLYKHLGRKIIVQSTSLVTDNVINYGYVNIFGKPNSFPKRFYSSISIRSLSNFISSFIWEPRNFSNLLYRPLWSGIKAGIWTIFLYFQDADQYFSARIPRIRNAVVSVIFRSIGHQNINQLSAIYNRIRNGIMSLPLSPHILNQAADGIEVAIPGNWGPIFAGLFRVDEDRNENDN